MNRLNSPLALCLVVASLAAAPALPAQASPQQQPPQQGQGSWGGRGQGMRGMFGPGMNGVSGTVTAVAGDEISVKNEQGEIYKIETSPNTHFRKSREEAKISDVHVGDVVMAAGNLDDQAKTVGAVFVAVLDPEQAARMEKTRADFGKTWTTGKVTAINDLTLTVERPDKVTQTIAVDENTTFHKRGEDVTFPDIKVGDMVRATGAVQGGNFLAASLFVMVPGEGRAYGRSGSPGQVSAQHQSQGSQPPPAPPAQSSAPSAAQPPNAPQN